MDCWSVHVQITDPTKMCASLVVSSTAFGSPGQIRFSYAVSQDTLEDAVSRVAKASVSLAT